MVIFSSHSRAAVNKALRFGLALIVACFPAGPIEAGDILRGGATSGATLPSANQTGGTGSTLPSHSMTNGTDTLARASQAVQAVRAMQTAAHDAAVRGANNLGRDPNHPGLQLPNVPNGLTIGGLQVAPGVPVNLAAPRPTENPALWQGARLPTQTIAAGVTNVSIKQTAQQALLNWETFNIGKQTTLTFNQSAGGANQNEWIAFNTISDPSGQPSQILGSIAATGQVYVLNQNGIIFGGSSQVNIHTLVASSLPINTNLLTRGLLNNPDQQFLFSALQIPVLPSGGTLPAFNPPPAPNTPSGLVGDVTVQAGATITSPTTADHVGGRVALVGLNATNDGTISTPDGQTILAAGEQVAMTAHSSTDPSLRGLDTYVGAIGPYGSIATNGGLIDAPRADVTLTGGEVDQNGVIASSTSVSLNGRIDLLANYNSVPSIPPGVNPIVQLTPSASGLVSLGPQSVTDILPELSRTERVVGSQLALPSQINLQGKAVHFEGNALLLAPNANVAVGAGSWLPVNPGFGFFATGGQIYLDPGATIDVSGSQNVNASVSENFITADLRGAEFANFPTQRDGPLRGQTVTIDIRNTGIYNGQPFVGTPLADLSGFVALVQRTVGELTIAGGHVTLTAGESVIVRAGASINVSGGSIAYAGAEVATTKVVSGGQIFDISLATPDRIYQGIYSGTTEAHPKWGIFETRTNPLISGSQFEPGYVQGGNGGSLAISAASMAVDGKLVGTTVVGPHQRTTPPVLSSLSFAFQANLPSLSYPLISPKPPEIFLKNGNLAPPGPFALDENGAPLPLGEDRQATVYISPDLLTTGGFGSLSVINSDGNITLPSHASLVAAAGGAITLSAANLDLEGDITAPGGRLDFSVYEFSPYEFNIAVNVTPGIITQTPPVDPTRGSFTLGSSSVLDVSGMVADDRSGVFSPQTFPLVTNGGSVTIRSYSADLKAGSKINASGGVEVDSSNVITYGSGGAITIRAGNDLNIAALLGGNLTLDSTLTAYGGANLGGSLSIFAPAIKIGGQTSNPDALLLTTDFFSRGGFGFFSLTGLGAQTSTPDVYLPAVAIAPGTTIQPVALSQFVDPNLGFGGDLVLTQDLLPQALRKPVSLSFGAPGVTDLFNGNVLVARGDFVMGAGASILTDPLASVSINANTAAVLGRIVVPGGTIRVTGGANSSTLFPNDSGRPLPTLDLGPQSVLSTAGTTLLTPNALGFRTGTVVAGGNIFLSGNIVAEAGSVLNVSGASDSLDVDPGFVGAPQSMDPTAPLVVRTVIDSNAGSITFDGRQELFSDAILIGNAGGPSAVGGSLLVSSQRFLPPGTAEPSTALDVTLEVTQNGPTIPTTFYPAGETAIGNAVVDENGATLAGVGHFAAADFNSSGFTSLTLAGTVQFVGPVTVQANGLLTVGTSGVVYADSAVHLNGAAVVLGQPFAPPIPPDQANIPFLIGNQPLPIPPTHGTGQLTVSGSLIDVGNFSLQNVGTLNLVARNGDIRGDGTLDVAGDISLTAGQVYPATEVTFNIAAFDYELNGELQTGSVTISASGQRQLPLSAGGELNIYATTISQGGVLRAPIGTINVGGSDFSPTAVDPISGQPFAVTERLTITPKAVTSVSAVDPVTGVALTIPFGTNENGTSFIDPAGVNITAGGVPGKTISVTATTLIDETGSITDLRGGGDLLAFRFVPGLGGTIDILGSTTSFAIVPGYTASYAPFDPIYTNASLAVGDQISLGSGSILPAGVYTLLPARYALLPGAGLVTPKTGTPGDPALQLDGASLVSGYRFNAFTGQPTSQPLLSAFEIAPQSVVGARAQYDTFSANIFLRNGALANNVAVPRLPIDAGQLILGATGGISIQGRVLDDAPTGGREGLVDINTPADILIAGPGVVVPIGTLLLDAGQLSSFGAESLLIGGLRHDTPDGSIVTVSTDNIIVNNPDNPLSGSGITLVANQSITLTAGSSVEQSTGTIATADPLIFGDASVPGSGNGVLLSVSSDPTASILRLGVDRSTSPVFTINTGASISGTNVILDSTFATALDPSAGIHGDAVALDSGQISILLDQSGILQQTSGLILSGAALQSLQEGTQSLSLLSYSSLDIYGTGQVGSASVASLQLHDAEIRGFNNNGGTVEFAAQKIVLDNAANSLPAGAVAATGGEIKFTANTILLGDGTLLIDQFTNTVLTANDAVTFQGGGALEAQGSVTVLTPLITGSTASTYSLGAAGSLVIDHSADAVAPSGVGGLGAKLTLSGESVIENSNIVLPSGTLIVQANGVLPGNNVSIGGQLDVSGTAQSFFDLVKYTGGGGIELNASNGDIILSPTSLLTAAAPAGGGDAGQIVLRAPNGQLSAGGAIAGSGGQGGIFNVDVGSLASTAGLDTVLNSGGFTRSRTFRVRTGDVLIDSNAAAVAYNLSADFGSITVTGVIDAYSNNGGAIGLYADGSVTLASGAQLNVAAIALDAAGKAGSVDLETRGSNGGQIEIQAGSLINLSLGTGPGGTLHLRAPQNNEATDLAVAPIQGSILNPQSIIIEAYRIFDASQDGSIDNQEPAVLGNQIAISNAAPAITARVLGSNTFLAPVLHVREGAEIVSQTGDLVLSHDWDLSTYRGGERKAVVDQNGQPLFDQSGNPITIGVEPGILTLRAKGSIALNGALSDGFGDSAGGIPFTIFGFPAPWLSPLLPVFADGTSQQSWSYRITAGADLQAADFGRTAAISPNTSAGSLSIGVFGDSIAFGGFAAQRDDALSGHYQVIRTGTGDIDISVNGDVRLQNQFATIYTAGTLVADPTLGGTFELPVLDASGGEASLGSIQEPIPYPVQYSSGGGNVLVSAGGDILHLTQDNTGVVIADSERQLPNNWLYRRGFVDPATGTFGIARSGDVASTTWWVDISNFFEGVGALGGGNVALTAGHDVQNVDVVVPTNARLPKDALDATQLVELGGGNLSVHAGHDLDGGVYYIERGKGILSAGNSIHTNSTRSPSLTTLTNEAPLPEQTWLPTTLFLGKGSFAVEAGADLTLGPVANPFLLPGGYSNTFSYKTYFSTYAATDSVDVSSLTGAVTLRESATLPTSTFPVPLLLAWERDVLLLNQSVITPAFFQPWIRLDESDVAAFSTVVALQPGTLRATSFSGDLNFVGRLLLSPSPTGTIDLAAAGAINGLQQSGVVTLSNVPNPLNAFTSGSINLSDTDPSFIPQIGSPFAYQVIAGVTPGAAISLPPNFLDFVNKLFLESGSTTGVQGVLQTKQELHAAGVLHANDPEPIHLYSRGDSVSGFTLFSGKATRIAAGQDVTDVSLYIQNVNDSDVSVVAANRDIVAYDPTSPLRSVALATGNILTPATPQAGDLQISGPGTLEILAGRNLDLGVGSSNPDGTGLGVTSIGNARNPFLPFTGAQIIAAAGIGPSSSLANSQLDFVAFDNLFLNPETATDGGARYLPAIGTLLGLTNATEEDVYAAFTQLSLEQQDQLALKIFGFVLRDSARDRTDPTAAGFGTYDAGFAAIAALFPNPATSGSISLPSKEIKTANGGDITLLTPAGGLTVGFASGTPAADQGILTEDGGNITIFTNNSVAVGTSRIFTLRGGNEIIFSTVGDIAAGASSKTVQSAPPTRVLIDPQSGDVKTDLAGLATGGGIGVLDTVTGVLPGDVDLIAPAGTVDAGDAGIRVTGNLNISAVQVLNAGNISVGGTSAGVPTIATPNLAGLTAASNSVAATTNAAETTANQAAQPTLTALPSIVTVEILGYGDGSGPESDDDDRRRRKKS